MFSLLYLKSVLVYDLFLFCNYKKTLLKIANMLEHEIWSSVNLFSWAMVTDIWLQNKPFITFEVRAVCFASTELVSYMFEAFGTFQMLSKL